MAGEVWSFREVRRDAWVILRDGSEWAMVTTVGERQHVSLRAMTRALAVEHDGVFEDHTIGGIDWQALGWDSRADHDAFYDDLLRLRDRWAGSPLAARIEAHVRAERRRVGVPDRRPYSVEQMDLLDRIVRRAPEIVAQDEAAEAA